MPETTATQQRSVPILEFTDAEAGAKVFPSSTSRTYNYFKPAKLRATMYEDVTCDVQPDPDRYLTQGWLYGFANSPGGYPLDWTKLQSSDWHAFRDPNQEWEQTIYRNNAAVVRQIGLNLENAKRAKAYSHWNSSWVQFIERNLGAWMHAEQGLGMHVFTPAQRLAPANAINNAMCVNAAHKLRFAQDLALYNLDLSESDIGFDGGAHRDAWQNDHVWQGVRENVERLTTITDWCELLFASNIVFEPLVGVLFRSDLMMQISARNGDYITPTIVGTGENDYNRDLGYSRVLFSQLTKDPEHGEANKALMDEWLAKWVPISLRAARELQPIWSQPHEKVITFSDSTESSKRTFRTILEAIDLEVPKELDQ
ncbi:MAG: aromatic/alkene monooxygenase hydroxylase subunit beta [Mycobacteriaceae bacterium]